MRQLEDGTWVLDWPLETKEDAYWRYEVEPLARHLVEGTGLHWEWYDPNDW